MKEVRGGKNNPLLYEREESAKINGKNNFLVSVCDLYIFDEDENLVLMSNSLSDCDIDMSPSGGKIKFIDPAFSWDLLKFVTKHQQDDRTDYQKVLNPKDNKVSLVSKDEGRYCKVVATADVRDALGNAKILKYIFPNCHIGAKVIQSFASDSISPTVIEINVMPDKESGIVCDIFLE